VFPSAAKLKEGVLAVPFKSANVDAPAATVEALKTLTESQSKITC
jgi:hypothetical protein